MTDNGLTISFSRLRNGTIREYLPKSFCGNETNAIQATSLCLSRLDLPLRFAVESEMKDATMRSKGDHSQTICAAARQ